MKISKMIFIRKHFEKIKKRIVVSLKEDAEQIALFSLRSLPRAICSATEGQTDARCCLMLLMESIAQWRLTSQAEQGIKQLCHEMMKSNSCSIVFL
jgi:hypothetical protein